MVDQPSAENSKRLTIRKYPNRRYYDTTRSRHVTLDEIYGLIRDGYEVQVTDSKSSRDITAKVLAQIIIELDPLKLDVFPVPLLHRLLRSNEQLVTDFIQKYFNQPLTAFLDSHRNFEQSLRQALGLHSPTPTVADWTKMMWGSINPTLWAAQATQGSERPQPPADRQVQEMRQMVEELRKQLAELQSKQPRPRRKKSRGNGST